MSEEEKIMLETNRSITNMETCFRNKIKELQQENKDLREQLETKHNGFMASVEESCELAKEVDLWNKKYNEEFDKNKELKEKYYCKYVDKCEEIDCTKEEYQTMAECNMRLSLENDELHNKIDKAIECINQLKHSDWICFGRKILLEILKGDVDE